MICEWKMYLNQATSDIVENIQKREDQLANIETEIDRGQELRTTEMDKLNQLHERLSEFRQNEEEKKERQEKKVEKHKSKLLK